MLFGRDLRPIFIVIKYSLDYLSASDKMVICITAGFILRFGRSLWLRKT